MSSALLLDVDAFVVKPVSKVGLANRLTKVLSETREVRPVADYASVPTEDRERKEAAAAATAEDPKPEPEIPGPGTPLSVAEVTPGAILARDLRNSANALVLPAGVLLTERYLLRLRELAAADPILGQLWVA